MTRSPLHRLDDIIRSVENALHAIEGRSRDSLEDDWILSHALQMAIVITAEAAKTLPRDLVACYPGVEWTALIKMGDRLKHNYHRLSTRVLWDTVARDLPILLITAPEMRESMEEPEPAE